MKDLTIEHVEYLAHQLAKQIMEWNEPIPDFSTRFPGRLESCLKTPFQSFAKKELYPKLEDKAATLFYLIIKNHPFQNGNKRIAVMSLLIFLSINKKWLSIPPDELYRLALWVAESQAPAKDGTVLAITDYIKRYLTEWNKSPFRDGEILFSDPLNQLCNTIMSLEQIIGVPKTKFPTFLPGTTLTAAELNQIMTTLDKLYKKMGLTKIRWKYMPVRNQQILTAATMNEIWTVIKQSVEFLQKKLAS